MNIKNAEKNAGPTSSHRQQSKSDKCDQVFLENKLKSLENSLAKSFKPELIKSIIYLIQIEHQDQNNFESSIDKIEWQKLDYFTHQFKKIVKNKTHLFLLNSQMILSTVHSRKQKNEDESINDPSQDYSYLINDFSSSLSSSEYFYLNQILVRFIFKLFKSKLNSNEILKSDYDVNKSQKPYKLSLILLSSLADLCFYEEIRIQVIHDPNLRCLLELFSSLTILELEVNFKRGKKSNCVQLMEKFWSKMCRLCANICQEKNNHRIKHLFSKDFMASLARCLDQQQVILVTNADDCSTELDLDLYHSLIRFIKYACEIENCNKLFIQNRILVFLCIYMYKLNKNIKLSDNYATKSNESQKTESDVATDNLSTPIPLNSKHYFLFKDLVKQFLIALDSWPASSEFYNQIIEGLFIEHLLWIQNKSTNNLNILSKESKSDLKFDYCEFSFNLLYKLCRDYHACRAEFGRIGGISKYFQKIETMTSNLSPSINKKMVNFSYIKEYTILIDIICLACKESVNRLRYKEQGLLVNLIKLQQTLKQNKDEINKLYKNDQQNEDISFIDSTLYNKILVALCCFAHDQDSMNILLNNSLVDCLLGYLNEGLDLKKKNEDEKMEIGDSDLDESKIFNLKKLLNLSDENRIINSKKRKTMDSAEPAQKPKRVNSELSAILSSSPPFLPTFQTSDALSFENHATSPTESCLSLSPNIYLSSSPPYIQSRCSSAQIFQGLSPNFYSNLSPTTSSDLPSSPSYFNFNAEQEIENERQIKFSPSINDEVSCSSVCSSENENIMEEEIDLVKEETNEDKSEINISQNIESINHTEACVFYVLSQLSHGDKPSMHLFQNFDSIVTALLKYLKKADVRNPRALRILNRLTKNQYCFPHFVLNRFPLKIKEIFFDAFNKKQISLKSKKSFRRSKSLSGSLSNEKSDTIEKEMNVYLNSNKAFFDASSFFPSFQSIEFILINNLKSQCISSSDSGYLSLISLAKQKKAEKLASSLVAPFILRNSKALSYILIQLNNLDLVFESLFEKCEDKSKFTSILCIYRILSFINYKRDLKQVKDLYDQARSRINEMLKNSDSSEQNFITFKFENNRNIKVNRNILLNKSEYFNLLLNGPFMNSDCIELKDVSEESFAILMEILKSRSLIELDSFDEQKINFEQCVNIIMTCDRFMLNDLRDLFMAIILMKFLTHTTATNCFKLAWFVNSDFLANATMDFVLSEYCSDSINEEENSGFKKFLDLFDSMLASLKENTDERTGLNSTECQTNLDYFKKTLKYALSEIIKNNSWKF